MATAMNLQLALNGGTPTLAIGYYIAQNEIWVCSKGAGGAQTVRGVAIACRPQAHNQTIVHTTTTVGGNFENMHAEMQIVNNVVATHDLAYKTDLATQLVIACLPNKDVCADCCGWMARHGIVHGVTCGARSDQGWKHPITKTGFRGDGQNVTRTPVTH
jgi:hypothetical protein